jgi:hypothetical protein
VNILGLDLQVYRSTWGSFLEYAELLGLSSSDRALLWREQTGTDDYWEWPVPIEYFLTDPFYVGEGLIVRPPIGEVLRGFWDISSQKEVLVFIAGLGSGKSFASGLSIAYALYLLSIIKRPARWLNRFPGVSLSDNAEIVLMATSGAGAEQASKVVYADTFGYIIKSPYFSQYFPPYSGKISELIFPNRVRFSPGTSHWRTALGWNVFGFTVDEAAFGQETARADYVAELFKALNQRRRSRFGTLGFGALVTSPGHDQTYVETLARQGEEWDHSVQVVRMTTWHAKGELVPGAQVFVFDRHPTRMRVVASPQSAGTW